MLTSKDFERHSHEYGDIIVSCPVHISKGIRQKENEQVLQLCCALLNSCGGILEMRNIDFSNGTQSKSLDAWWSGMESNLANIMSCDDICNYFDFIGNYDDEYFYLFVKSAEYLCTLDYNCRLPTDTATHCVTYQSAIKLCSTMGCSKPLSALPPIPSTFLNGQIEESLKQEGKQIQFKLLVSEPDSTRTLGDKVCYHSSRYISAFANHEGGHIYFGIEDATAAIYGEEISERDEVKCTNMIQSKMNSIIWGDTRFAALKGVHWDIKFIPVFKSPNQQRRKVIVVSVCKMFGGVFTSCPESYVLTSQVQANRWAPKYGIRRLEFDEWKAELLNQTREVKSLNSRFVKIPLRSPQSRLVYSLPHTLQAARERVIKLSPGLSIHPKNILQSLPDDDVRKAVSKLIGTFSEEAHLVVFIDSWGLELDLPPRPTSIKASFAVISSLYGIHLACLVSNPLPEHDVWQFSCLMAIRIKNILVQHGGCVSHLGIKTHVLDMHAPFMLENFQGSIDVDVYPQTYKLREDDLNEIITALTVAVASYKNLGSEKGTETDFYFLLTCDQLELLWCHQFTKELWIHGPPGSGKTIAALEMMKEFLRRGCLKHEILYVAENPLLCSFVRSFDLCLVRNRRELLLESVNPTLSGQYSQIKNVIVDEAQNFKDRDGDWYALLEKLSKQNVKDPKDSTCGYFWVFMDYAQKVHKFEAGLPGLIGKNNFILREISRNSKEIYDYAKKFMESSAEAKSDECVAVSKLGHEYMSGEDVSVLKCDKAGLQEMLYKVLKHFTDLGVDVNDMAILVSKKKEAEEIEKTVREGNLLESVIKSPTKLQSLTVGPPKLPVSAIPTDSSLDQTDFGSEPVSDSQNSPPSSRRSTVSADGKHLTVSTVREFSGLDKSVIIGLEPHINQDHGDMDKFLLNLVTRAKDSLVILTTSDKMMGTLKQK
ncbi:unnamed protein product [Lymnaea stagnalis]|uniref:Schlafen AlbA-2 domain-containing protein n=1 Tax=Lymnaea stagnalis TaxID=6523 RepID=A0AAV2H8Z4_LYMST